MDARSIDVAKTASIDLMNLNNKVVNMRPIVKRTKAQVVNRLCRNISALKKKKGTEAQKEKNIRKAERLIEEIESIRRLKEDKVSKYSLANMSTFESVSKSTVSPSMRALARLAEHHLMKEAVNNFRENHSDWRDLAAFLLVKQTGRKFKTKKQKQNKLARRVENINASETMTKVYIQERFGQEGVEKAEKRFQTKRKKGKLVSDKVKESNVNDTEKSNVSNLQHKEKSTNLDEEHKDGKSESNSSSIERRERQNSPFTINQADKEKNEDYQDENTHSEQYKELHSSHKDKNTTVNYPAERLKVQDDMRTEGEEDDDDDDDDDDEEEEKEEEEESDKLDESEEVINMQIEEQSNQESEECGEKLEDNLSEESDSDDDNVEKLDKQKRDKSNESKLSVNNKSRQVECVVKELKIGLSSDEENDSSSDNDDESSAESSDNASSGKEAETDSDILEESDVGNDESESELPCKKQKVQVMSKSKKSEGVPEFLTKRSHVLKNTPNDPFFEGSDGEEEDEEGGVSRYSERDIHNYGDNTDFTEYGGSWSNKQKTQSMFYDPNDKDTSRRRFERKDSSSSFRFGRRGHLDSRGRGRSLDRNRGDFNQRGQNRGGNVYFKRGKRIEVRGGFSGNDRGKHKFGSGIPKDVKQGSFSGQRLNQRGNGDKMFGNMQKSSQRFGAPSSKDTSTSSISTEKLHPSWEASRKRKAEQSSLKAFEGTKIVFDDD